MNLVAADLIEVRYRPSAVPEAIARVFSRAALGLHDAVERELSADEDSAHRKCSVRGVNQQDTMCFGQR